MSRAAKEKNANLAQQDGDDEPGLLMMEASELAPQEIGSIEQVFLNEEKVVPKLSGSRDISWYLHTGASNHMTGNHENFVELDESVKGKVHFSDGSAVEICGRGSVLMQCHFEEHRILSDVYFIP